MSSCGEYFGIPYSNMILVEMQKVQDDTVGLGETAAGSSGLVAKAYAALTLAFAGAGASYIFLAEDTLTVRALSKTLPAYCNKCLTSV